MIYSVAFSSLGGVHERRPSCVFILLLVVCIIIGLGGGGLGNSYCWYSVFDRWWGLLRPIT